MGSHNDPKLLNGFLPEDEKADVYEERINTIVNDGFVALGIALGHKVGLIKALNELKEPETSQVIAERARLQERYVREWLFAMVAAKIVFITDDNKYYIPADCKKATNKSLFATLLTAIAPLTSDLEQCFRSKDVAMSGYDFSNMEGVFLFNDEDRKKYDGKWLDENLFPHTLLKRDQIKNVLDIGCGTGRSTINIAKHFPAAHVIGIDLESAEIEKANQNRKAENLNNIDFFAMNADKLEEEWTGKFDWVIMLTVLHDLPNPDQCVKEVLRVMKADGVFTAMDMLGYSDPKLNVGNKLSASTLILSCYICLPCSLSAPPAVGNGAGWGLENRAKYLETKGFKVHENKLVSIIHCTKDPLLQDGLKVTC